MAICNQLRLLLITFVLVISVTSTKAQLSWRLKIADQTIGPTGNLDSMFEFSAISCFGNNCTVGAEVTDTALNPSLGYYFFYRSTNGGLTWFRQNPSQSLFTRFFNSHAFVKIQQIDSLNIVAIGDSGFILRTFDAGATWERQYCATNRLLLDVHFVNSLLGIICDGNNVFTTSDGGKAWSQKLSNIKNICQCHVFGEGKYKLLKRPLGVIYSTNDDFATLDSTEQISDPIIHPLAKRYLLSHASFKGDTIFTYGRVYDSINFLSGQGLLIKSTNAGKNWGQPLISNYLYQIDHLSELDDTIFAGGYSDFNHILISSNDGTTWKPDSLLLDFDYFSIYCNGLTKTFDGNILGIFSTILGPGPGIVVRSEWQHAGITYDPRLVLFGQKIYPNPSNADITISVGVQSMPIAIYDMLGREIIREMLPESGKLTLNLSDYPAGAYNVLLYDHKRTIPLGKIMLIGK